MVFDDSLPLCIQCFAYYGTEWHGMAWQGGIYNPIVGTLSDSRATGGPVPIHTVSYMLCTSLAEWPAIKILL